MSNYRIARLAFPAALSKTEADDIVATANELGDGRWSARQSVGLVSYGLRTRGRLATNGRRRRYWAQGIGFGLVALYAARGLMWGLHATGLATLPVDPVDVRQWLPQVAASLASLVIVLRSTRARALLAVALIQVAPLVLTLTADRDLLFTPMMRPSLAFNAAVATGLFLLHRFGDGRPAASAPFVGTVLITAALPAIMFDDATITAAVVPVLAVVGVASIRVDPRWAIGAATTTLYNFVGLLALGLTDIVTIGLIGVTVLVLAAAHSSAAKVRTA